MANRISKPYCSLFFCDIQESQPGTIIFSVHQSNLDPEFFTPVITAPIILVCGNKVIVCSQPHISEPYLGAKTHPADICSSLLNLILIIK